MKPVMRAARLGGDRAEVLAELHLGRASWRSASMMCCTSPTATITDAAMQRWPAQPVKLATTFSAVSRVGVGHHDQVVLRAAEAERALAARGGAPVHELGDAGGCRRTRAP
jgi:hypothetical protein